MNFLKSGVMKNLWRIILCAVLLLSVSVFNGYAQAPRWEWAKSAGGLLDDQPQSIAVDSSGNIFVTGTFRSLSITFGTTTLYNFEQNNREINGEDIFIVKYDRLGNVLWAQSAGGKSNDRANSIAVDRDGNIYLTGFFYDSTITFGNIKLVDSVFQSQNSADLFIVKYDPSGNVLWAKKSFGYGDGIGTSIRLDYNSNIYISGSCAGSFKIDTATLTNETSGGGSAYMFVLKMNASGTVLWSAIEGSYGLTYGTGIVADGNGNMYSIGTTTSNMYFKDFSLGASGGTDLVIIKYSPKGKILWAKVIGGKYDETATAITVDNTGNILVTGSFYGSALGFGSIILTGNTKNIYTVKFAPNGGVLWAKAAGGVGQQKSSSIITDQNNNIYITGFFTDSLFDFGELRFLNPYHSFSNIFIAKYSSDGSEIWGESLGGTYADEGLGMALDPKGNLMLAGFFWFSNLTLGNHILENKGYADMFVAKLGTGITSVENSHNESSLIHIFPNPTASQFHITIPEPGNWTITIYTLDGQSVFKKELTEAHAIIDLSGKAKGAYVYRLLKDGEVLKTGKIVLE